VPCLSVACCPTSLIHLQFLQNVDGCRCGVGSDWGAVTCTCNELIITGNCLRAPRSLIHYWLDV